MRRCKPIVGRQKAAPGKEGAAFCLLYMKGAVDISFRLLLFCLFLISVYKVIIQQ